MSYSTEFELALYSIASKAQDYVIREIEDDPTQAQEGCALWPLIQALEKAGFPVTDRV